MTTNNYVSEAFLNVLQQADCVVENAAINAGIEKMAQQIANDYKNECPVYLTIMHGGLIFSGQLALALGKLGMHLTFDYLHATRYRGETSGGDLIWKHRPATALYGREVLLVDDILDEGYTLEGVRQWCLEQGASTVKLAALAVKQHDRCLPDVKADYMGVYVPDRYVFGYGMDFKEEGRNLPNIYAMKESA